MGATGCDKVDDVLFLGRREPGKSSSQVLQGPAPSPHHRFRRRQLRFPTEVTGDVARSEGG